MTAVWLETRGIIYLVLYVVLILYAGRQGFALVRSRIAGVPLYPPDWSAWQRRLLTAIYVEGAVGMVAVWIMLIHAGPPLMSVLYGHARGTPWIGMLIYTTAWLWSLRPIQPLAARPDPRVVSNVHIGMRATGLALMFFFAIASIKNW
jgi:hypothetical protein